MNLSPKALRFIIEVLGYRIQAYEAQLESDSLDEDTASEIGNDALYLETLRQELSESLNSLPSPLPNIAKVTP
ncbi:MAG: hypothetical protein KME10_11855 [Plectolyngbya sp. WJT66-NPBG17]|jgi:hypothetical protein|nr:hypothetical protein [Plectolyngbya sp. WJT66-NPBG17]MBW4527218.1 hypothetical protein [Phormidium tanganyikae FI6-MK23]